MKSINGWLIRLVTGVAPAQARRGPVQNGYRNPPRQDDLTRVFAMARLRGMDNVEFINGRLYFKYTKGGHEILIEYDGGRFDSMSKFRFPGGMVPRGAYGAVEDCRRRYPKLESRFIYRPKEGLFLFFLMLPVPPHQLTPEAVEMIPNELANIAVEIDKRLSEFEER